MGPGSGERVIPGGGSHAQREGPGSDRPLRVAVVGAADAGPGEYEAALALGRRLAELGLLVICGGRSGVMEAVARGAFEAGGRTVGILPGTRGEDANSWIEVPIATGLGEARNAVVVRSAEAVIGIGGGWGTLSELALGAKMGVPVSTLGPGPKGLREVPSHLDVERAATWAVEAASGYRSRGE
jgi:uncharacterized protein (TIGR00725 family)